MNKVMSLSQHTADWVEFNNRVEQYFAAIKQKADDTELNRVRDQIAEEVLGKSELEPGVFVLNVPTGGGKTLLAIRLACRHGQHHNKDRFIYAAPYLSIIDQNADELRECFGHENVLEHHSNFRWADIDDDILRKKFRSAQQNWDFPVIATTTVQLLESLFSSRCGRLRKLQNIAGSIIFIDEFQSIPMSLMKVTYRRLKELADHYGCTIILGSATSPVDQIRKQGLLEGDVTQLVSDPSKFEYAFERVTKKWLDTTTWSQILDRAQQYDQAMIITNKKRGCARLYRLLDDPCVDHVFHLSTAMEPSHRREQLDEIRYRLDNDEPVLLICTPTVEAGVDIDFPVAFKQLSPMDSIIQAAGRVNREGQMDGMGELYVFSIEPWPKEEWLGFPDGSDLWFQKWRETKWIFQNHVVNALDHYYNRIFLTDMQEQCFDRSRHVDYEDESLVEAEGKFAFHSADKMYQIIHQISESVVIEGRTDSNIRQILDKERLSKQDWQTLQSVSISSYKNRLKKCDKWGYLDYVGEEDETVVWTGPYDETWGTIPYEFKDLV